MREYEMINIDSIFAIFFIRYRFRIAMCVNARMQSQGHERRVRGIVVGR